METLKKASQLLGLDNKTNQFLTLALWNGLLVFIYDLFSKKLFFGFVTFNGLQYNFHFMEKTVLLALSTICFSFYYKVKGTTFQEKTLNKYQLLPNFFLILIKVEYFFTKEKRKDRFAVFALFFIFTIQLSIFFSAFFGLAQYIVFKVLYFFFRYLLILYIFFRTLFNSCDFEKYPLMNKEFNDYIKIYKTLQKKQITFNRNIHIIFLFLTISIFYKFYFL